VRPGREISTWDALAWFTGETPVLQTAPEGTARGILDTFRDHGDLVAAATVSTTQAKERRREAGTTLDRARRAALLEHGRVRGARLRGLRRPVRLPHPDARAGPRPPPSPTTSRSSTRPSQIPIPETEGRRNPMPRPPKPGRGTEPPAQARRHSTRGPSGAAGADSGAPPPRTISQGRRRPARTQLRGPPMTLPRASHLRQERPRAAPRVSDA
jgi:hypothetical protein